ncbi:hypothetical protein [Paraclostridium sordellii]|uniref:hypothetical protein n=1 Tax=Paraclostridium sordellii TaxID=1505 RepID=UPI0005E2A506|nr:hypothetical protein [Paeniclostridium sordellii]CEN86632.1 glycosyltransferase [[Clostridium] sordellii] [Paeniclostridium sordellii]
MIDTDKLLNDFNLLSSTNPCNFEYLTELESNLNSYKNFDRYNLGYSDEVYCRFKVFLQKMYRLLDKKKSEATKLQIEKLEDNYKTYLYDYLDFVSDNSDTFVFMFSGVGKITPLSGNRPVKLTLELISRNIPVLYSFWRYKNSTTQFMDLWDKTNLFQIPVDKALQSIMDIITYKLKCKNKIFVLSFPYPEASKYIEIFKFYGWSVVYDIRDDWEEFHLVNQAKWYNKSYEYYSILKSNLVIATSQPLINKFSSKVNKEIHLVTNALDSKFIINKSRLNFIMDRNINRRKKIGYFGHLTSSWFDWDALIYTATKLPNYHFEIIGHSMPPEVNNLPSNISYIGPKTPDEIKSISMDWKIGIIPFKINKLTKAVDPIKIYEYLALDLKVVSFDMPQIRNYPEVKCANSFDEFVNLINISMNEKFNFSAVKEFLSNNLWSNRVDTIFELLSNK